MFPPILSFAMQDNVRVTMLESILKDVHETGAVVKGNIQGEFISFVLFGRY